MILNDALDLRSRERYFYLHLCVESNIRLYSVKGGMTMAFHDNIMNNPGNEVYDAYISDIPVNVILLRHLDKLGIVAKAVENANLSDCIKFNFNGWKCYAVTDEELLKVIKSYETIVDDMMRDGTYVINID